jgi:hypothetical protein
VVSAGTATFVRHELNSDSEIRWAKLIVSTLATGSGQRALRQEAQGATAQAALPPRTRLTNATKEIALDLIQKLIRFRAATRPRCGPTAMSLALC